MRCLKPNGHKEAGRFDGGYVQRQLLYNGVLAIVEIQAAGNLNPHHHPRLHPHHHPHLHPQPYSGVLAIVEIQPADATLRVEASHATPIMPMEPRPGGGLKVRS